MSIEAMKLAWNLDIQSPAQKNVLVVLANYANQDHDAYPSVAKISRYTAFSERTVRQALRDLEAAGWIIRTERRDENGRTTTASYRLTFVTDEGGSSRPHQGAAAAGGGGESRRGEGARAAPNPLYRSQSEPKEKDTAGKSDFPLFGEPIEAARAAPSHDAAELVAIWDEICGGKIGKVRKLTDKRRRALTRAMREEFNNSADEWRSYCQRIANSPFLCGETGGTFRADFDWVLEPDKMVRILEGRYRDTRSSGRPKEYFPDGSEIAPGTI